MTIDLELYTTEHLGHLANGTSYTFWTFNDTVPGPFILVRVGDTVNVSLTNDENSRYAHSVDFHAVTGPGGGATVTQTPPGETTRFTFKALNPGLYVYHCATASVAHHITQGMYGLILVEPEGGLSEVDHEFYVMQGELYTIERYGTRGELSFDIEKMMDERAEYLFFNGAVDALTTQYPLQAEVGDTIRIFFGVGGPNYISSFHVIGEIFDRVHMEGGTLINENVQTTLVPAGGATIVEMTLEVPGRMMLVDHALSRAERGLAGYLEVSGEPAPEIFHGIESEGHGH
jgi:nitrite reductase (NO-forming)